MHRRTFLCGCGAFLAYGGHSKAQTPLKPFICSTLQVTPQDELRNLRNSLLSRGPFIPQQLFDPIDAWTEQDSLTKGKIRIGVAFLDGTQTQKDYVETYVKPWTEKGGAEVVEWAWGDRSRPHIRITFKGKENQTHIGRQAASVTDLKKPTMALCDVKTDSGEERIRQVVLHEFGHALGLRHEIQHPKSGIKWRPDNVYADLHSASNWSKEDVRRNVLEAYSETFLCKGAKEFDPNSIMMYPVLDTWAENFSATPGSTLSPGDLQCVASQYWLADLLLGAPTIEQK